MHLAFTLCYPLGFALFNAFSSKGVIVEMSWSVWQFI